MGGGVNLDVPTIFEQKLSQALAGTKCVFLFDQISLQEEVGEYYSIYYKLCDISGRNYFEMEGDDISEQEILQQLAIKKTRAASDKQRVKGAHHSTFRVLCDVLEIRKSGVLCIHNAHQLSPGGVKILSRMITFVRRMKLNWQFIIFADVINLSEINKLQLSIDAAYPEYLIQDSKKYMITKSMRKTGKKGALAKPSLLSKCFDMLVTVLCVGTLVLLAAHYF